MLYLISYFTVILCTWKYFAEVINVFNTCKDFCIKIIIVKIFFFSEWFKTLTVCQDLEVRKQRAGDQSPAYILGKCTAQLSVSLCILAQGPVWKPSFLSYLDLSLQWYLPGFQMQPQPASSCQPGFISWIQSQADPRARAKQEEPECLLLHSGRTYLF